MPAHSRPKDGLLSHACGPAVCGTASQHPLMPAHSRPKDGVLSHAYAGIQHWIPAFAGMSGGCRSDLLVKQPSVITRIVWRGPG
jgi:hypothetical protein